MRALAVFVVFSVLSAGCAAGSNMGDDGGPDSSMDGSNADAESGDAGDRADASFDGGRDAGPPVERSTCEACEDHADCGDGAFCVDLTVGGRACVPGCNPDIPTCPRAFNCVLDVSSGVDSTVCLPIGGGCCVDDDADSYGVGVGCIGPDCDDENENANPGVSEICNGEDDDCDGAADDPPTDCLSGRCTMQTDGTYESVEGANCVDAACVAGTTTDCGLFSCEDGGELGNRCGTSCDPGGADDDMYCIAGAHCESGACTTDVPNGGMCDEDTDCASAHCENGFCCQMGACCSVAADCPGTGGVGTVCTDASRCEGTRGELACIDNMCDTLAGIPDDSACNSTTQARDCGFFDPVFCNGGMTQTAPPCPTTCTNDSECIDSAHCEAGSCAPDRNQGGACSRPEDCRTGLFCADGFCCDGACNGTCEACDLPATRGVCTLVPAGGDPDGECPALSCNGYYVAFDGLGRCFRHSDVPDAIAACNGGGTCMTATTMCPMQPAGSVQIDCHDTCESPASGTCMGTTAGMCDDLDSPTDTVTCGVGACARTVQRCTGGTPTTCTPGTPVVESCNGIDDDCNGQIDNGSASGLCPPGANVSTTACMMGACTIMACQPRHDDCDRAFATGCERPLTTLTDCGSCGTPCSLTNAGETCMNAVCEITTCTTGFADCDGMDATGCERSSRTLTDCGGCGVACDLANSSESCSTGTCEIVSCTTGFGDCDLLDNTGCERSLRTLTDCGNCGTICNIAGATESCATGTCEQSSCEPLFADCDTNTTNGCERPINTLTDCGGCGIPCSLANASESCTTGTCTLGMCSTGFANCDMNPANGCETNTRTLSNCGGCGTQCDLANANEDCSTGICSFVGCNTGYGNCDTMPANGCEVQLTTLTNCAVCGVGCALAHATETCGTGACEIVACDTGWDDCDGIASNGCETSLRTLTDCGTCGSSCALNNATESCSTGTCQVVTCDPLFANCDTMHPNGCERPTNTLADCGGCGTACDLANGSESCTSGTCTLGTCDTGWSNCDGAGGNGCERSIRTLTDCNGCGTPCNLANATESCMTGACLISMCDPLFRDCDGMASNGCERAINTLTDCGNCGVPCDLANAGESCTTGTCTLGTCDPLFRNCDGMSATGCERPINTLTDCGNCGVSCDFANAGESCTTGTCTMGMCNSGFDNCDGMASTGCERSIRTLTDCGACNVACNLANASETCTSGTCLIDTCTTGFEDCDGSDMNGCERNIRTTTDCNGCGVSCSLPNATATCSTGVCLIASCTAGWEDCDGIDSNGCERNIRTLTDCGGCGVTCSRTNATPTCSTGTCAISMCNTNWGNCDGTDGNGCERPINTLTDCGMCNIGCSLANAGESCMTGACLITSCTGLFMNCDGVHSNGCERATNTLTDCGGCGTTCALANASETCSTGACQVSTCDALFQNCDGLHPNGCERATNTLTDCGGCGTPCALANATESCTTGSCQVAMCSANFGNCDGSHPNGCERNHLTDVNYCGNCTTNCATAPHPNANGEACASGACDVTSCVAGFFDQNNVFSDGCECAADTYGGDCANAFDLGTLGLDTSTNRTGNLVAAGDSDWFRISFPAVSSCNFNPRVTLSVGGEPIAMEVYTSCAGGVGGGGFACGEGGTSANRANQTTWEYTNSATCGNNLSIDPTPAIGTYITVPTAVWIRVFATGSSSSCLPYTVTIAT